MGGISKPTETKWWVARSADGSTLHYGSTEPDQVTTSGQPAFEISDDQGGMLEKLARFSGKFPELKIQDDLYAGDIYQVKGELFMVRKPHKAVGLKPKDDPSIFLWHREDSTKDQWVAKEKVSVGTVREYLGVVYKCLQAHVTGPSSTPNLATKLWAAVK